MGVNKVIYGGNTLIDVSETTVTPKTMLKGVTAVDATGELITGTLDVDIVEVPESVDFYDYDGTLLYSYTLEEMQALTELPAGATHDGLVFQGWNWSLENIKAHNRSLVVGALYTTDDGVTRIYINLKEGRTSPQLGIGVNGTVVIAWGDGTTTTLTGTSTNTVQWTSAHSYSSGGDYVIELTVNGEIKFLGDTDGSYLLRHSSEPDNRNAVYLNSIKRIELADGNVNIGDYAFYWCASLVTISVPENIPAYNTVAAAQFIGTNAFHECKSLRAVTLPSGLRTLTNTFVNCTSLATVAVPEKFVDLAEAVFHGCSSLKNITLPDELLRIGNKAFLGCSKITSLHIPDITTMGENAFTNCDSLLSVTIPNTITKIELFGFQGCGSLKSVGIPDSVTSIGANAFHGCKALGTVKIPESVTEIGSYAFYNCVSLTKVIIPEGVTSINAHTFYGCSGLMSVEISDSVTSIAANAFNGCKALESIIIPDNVTTIGSAAFQDCNSLSEVTIPNGVTSVEASLFRGCTSLKFVGIPESVATIGGYAFYGCHSLESIALPNDITGIGTYAFHSCASLETVEIPGGVTSISSNAFYGCKSLSSAKIVERQSKNLLRNQHTDATKGFTRYGITFSPNADGSINISGTATASINLDVYLTGDWQSESVVYPSDRYRIHLTHDTGASVTAVVLQYDGSTQTVERLATTSSRNKEFEMFITGVYLSVVVTSGTTYSGTIQPMLTYADVTDSTYEAYKEPYSVTSIGSSAFQECSSLASFTFPSTITSIGNQAFNNCYGMRSYRFSDSLTVPTLGTNVYVGIADDCEIEVPYALYDTWKSAANWSTYADYFIKGEPV